jgi:hypothetical protein
MRVIFLCLFLTGCQTAPTTGQVVGDVLDVAFYTAVSVALGAIR